MLPKEWRGDMVTGRTDAIELNKALTTMRNKILKAINGMLKEGCLNIQEIPSRMKRLDDAGKTFCEYCQDRAEVRQYGRMDDTCKRYDRFLKWFRAWGGLADACFAAAQLRPTERSIPRFPKTHSVFRKTYPSPLKPVISSVQNHTYKLLYQIVA